MSVPRVLWGLLAAGIAIRLFLAFAFVGVEFDIGSMQVIQRELATGSPFDVYGGTNLAQAVGDAELLRWPYPPGFFIWIGISAQVENLTGLPFHGLVQLLSIACDAALAIAIYVFLGWRGAAQRTRLLAAALVLLGPSFIAISGYHGQIDSVAILPALLALMIWQRPGSYDRALVAGLLVGVGIAVKWVPAFALLALLPSALGWREMVRLVGFAAIPPALALAPFVLADPHGVATTLGYSGAPGLGGLGLAIQPGLAEPWLTQEELLFTGPSQFIYDHASQITALGLLGLGGFLFRYRPAAVDAAVLVWLTVYVVAPNFFFQYLIWGLPFFLLAGFLRYAGWLQVALLAPTLIIFILPPTDPGVAFVYVPIMLAVWVGWIVALITVGRKVVRARAAHPIGTQPPLVQY